MKIIQEYITKNDCFERMWCRIIAGFACIASIGLLTACQNNAGTGSEGENLSETGLNTATEAMEELTEENRQASSDYTYEELEDGTLRLTAYQPEHPLPEGEALEVPSEIDGKEVTVIGEGCFSDEEELEWMSGQTIVIILPEGITTLEDHIMNRWIRCVEIPDSVHVIGEEAFFYLQSYNNYETQEDGTLQKSSYRESEWKKHDGIIIQCSKGSVAETYARNQNMRYRYPDDNWRMDEAFLEHQYCKDYQYFDQYRVEGTHTNFCVIEYEYIFDKNDKYSNVSWSYDVVVLDKTSDEELQRITLSDNELSIFWSSQFHIQEEDADFDGEPEILIFCGTTGNQEAALYYCYDWNPVSGQYVEYESFRGIMNPQIDNEVQVVRSYSRGGANLHYEYEYVFQNGEFIMTVERERITEEKNGLVEELVNTSQMIDGEWHLTDRTLYTYDDGELLKEEQQPLD